MDGETRVIIIMIDNGIHGATRSDDLNRSKWDINIGGQGAFGKGCSRGISITSVAALFFIAIIGASVKTSDLLNKRVKPPTQDGRKLRRRRHRWRGVDECVAAQLRPDCAAQRPSVDDVSGLGPTCLPVHYP